MIATAALCMSLQSSLVTGGVDSLINDLVCDFAVPTSHDFTRAEWFETPSSLRTSAKFDSLFHENTRDGPDFFFVMAHISGWFFSLVPGWICCTVPLRGVAGAFMLCCALRLCFMQPRTLSLSQQCCWHDGADIFFVNGMILHAGSFFSEVVGLLLFARYFRILAQNFVCLCWNGKKSISHSGAWKKGNGNEDTSQSYSLFWLPSQVIFSIAAACAAAAILQVGLVGLMSGVLVSVAMLKNSTLQTAAACCAAAIGRFLFGRFLIVANTVAACLEVSLAAVAWSAAAFLGTFSLVHELAVIGATRSMGTTTLLKGSSCAATAAASPRLDVEKAPHAAAAAASIDALTSSGHVWTDFGGQPGPGHTFQRVEEEGRSGGGKLDSFFVFVVSLDGSSVQVRVDGTDSYENLAVKIAAKVNIPQCHWYLTFSGKDLQHVPLPVSMLHRDSSLRMCSRLLGGAPLQPTPGEWFCPACNRGGCWASRRTCFRCLAPRPAGDSTPLQPQSRGRNQRERRALGREPQRSPNQCPTERRPPVQPSGANAQDARASTPSVNRRQPQPSLNAASVLELLKGLNLPDDILDVVSNKLTPAPPEPKPEKLLLDMRLKIDSLTKEADRLEGVVRTKTTELHTACQRSADKARELADAQQEYNDLKERIDRPMEETQEPAPPPAPVVSNPADVPVDLDEQGFDMDLNNPGVEEENEDEAGPTAKRKRLSHFDQMMAGLSHFDNESLVTFLGHVQAHAEQQNAIAQEVAEVSGG